MSQKEALELIQQGQNCAVIGGAGVGKSHIIRQILDGSTVLAAPTGIAALNIGGETCHSLFGLPFGLVTDEDRNKEPRRITELFSDGTVRRIIFDESFMIRADHFDLIDYRLQQAKRNRLPFGGIQVVIVGDPFQLPPIVNKKEIKHFKKEYKSPFIFHSKCWKEAELEVCLLHKVYRQSEEKQIALLNALRVKNKHWQLAVDRLNEWCEGKEDGDQVTLCNYREDADILNFYYYRKIKETEITYEGDVEGTFKEADCVVDRVVKLKKGCKIIIRANCENKTYRNGQRAVVRELYPDRVIADLESCGSEVIIQPHTWERVKYSKLMGSLTKTVEGSFTQMPISLGYAITVHSAQGMTLDSCSINLGYKSFAPAQTYVAFSRVRDLRDISLTRPVEYEDIIVDKNVLEFYKTLGE